MSNNCVQKSKLFLLIKTFDKKELKTFDNWLSSKFHNQSEKVLNLYRGLRSIYNKLDRPVEKHILLKFVGIKINVDSGKPSAKNALILRQTMSALTQQIQEFLCWQKFKEDNIRVNCCLVDALMDRRQFKLVPAILQKSKKELQASPNRNILFYEHIFQLTERKFHIDIILNNRSTKVEIQQDLINKLWQTHIVRVLKYYCAAKNIEKIRKINYVYPLIEPLKQYIKDSSENDVSLVKMFYTLLILIEKEEPEYFYELKKYLFKNFKIFDVFIVRQFLNYLTNYCARVIKLGKDEFIKEKQDVYQFGLKLKCWSSDIYFSSHQFTNIVINSLLLGKIDWTKNFLNDYKEQLNPVTKEDTLNYCNALLHFQINEFDEAHNYMLKITSPEDFIYHLGYKILLIKIYYECQSLTIENEDTHPINYELESIRHYIMSTRNKRMSESLRESYKNFVNLFRRILKRKKKLINKEIIPKEDIDKLKKELFSELPFVERDWLKKQVEDLKVRKQKIKLDRNCI